MIRIAYINSLIICFICSIGFSLFGQDQTMIQLKTLDHQLRPIPNLNVILNNGSPNQVDDKGLAFIEMKSSELPPATVRVLNNKLEVESWNFSKGILEVVVRPKNHQEITAVLQDENRNPIPEITVVYNSNEPVSAVSDRNGRIAMNVPIDHDLNQTNLFTVRG